MTRLSRLSCQTRKSTQLWLGSLSIAALNGALLHSIGVRDRETTLSSWIGLKTSGDDAFAPITVWGTPSYVQWQGLGNRLPLFGNLGNPITLFLSEFLSLGHIRLLLVVIASLIGTHAFLCCISQSYSTITRSRLLLMLCFSLPFVGISLRHTTLNDWSENSITFWATVGLFSSAVTLGECSSRKKTLPHNVVPTLVFCLTTLSLGHPMTGILIFLPVFLVSAFVWLKRPTVLNKVELLILSIALCVYVTAQCVSAIDMITEFREQTQFQDIRRVARYTESGLVWLVTQFVSRQTGVIGSSELGFTGFSLFLYVLGKDRPLPIRKVRFLLFCNTAVLFSSEISRVNGVSTILSGERFGFSEWALILNLIVLGQIALAEHKPESLTAVRGFLKALRVISLMPLLALPISVTRESLASAIPKWRDTVEGLQNSVATQDRVLSGQFAYISEAIHRELTTDIPMSFGPTKAQSVGISTLNTYSRVRSSQTLVKPRSLFENGIRENFCIDRWVAGFIQLDVVIGERFCDEGWETTKLIETNHRKFWIHDLSRESHLINEPCPLLQANCQENWRTEADFFETSLASSEYFHRCVTTCVARFRIRGDFLNVLVPINFDSGIRVVNKRGDSLRTSNFRGLLLVEIPPGSSSPISGTLQFKPDLRTYLRSGTNLLLTVMLLVAAVLALSWSRKLFRSS